MVELCMPFISVALVAFYPLVYLWLVYNESMCIKYISEDERAENTSIVIE